MRFVIVAPSLRQKTMRLSAQKRAEPAWACGARPEGSQKRFNRDGATRRSEPKLACLYADGVPDVID